MATPPTGDRGLLNRNGPGWMGNDASRRAGRNGTKSGSRSGSRRNGDERNVEESSRSHRWAGRPSRSNGRHGGSKGGVEVDGMSEKNGMPLTLPKPRPGDSSLASQTA